MLFSRRRLIRALDGFILEQSQVRKQNAPKVNGEKQEVVTEGCTTLFHLATLRHHHVGVPRLHTRVTRDFRFLDNKYSLGV
jgi:hypothetical protein